MLRNNFEIHNVEQGSDEWKKLREGYYTASQAGNAMGVGYAKQSGEVSDYMQAMFDYGHEVEDTLRPTIEAELFGFNRLSTPTATCEIEGVKLLASLDGWVEGLVDESPNQIWECKAAGFNGKLSKDAELMFSGGVPEKHYWQLQHQMMVFACNQATLTVAVMEDGLITKRKDITVACNPEYQRKLLDRYKEMETEEVKAPDDMQVLFQEYAVIKEQERLITSRLKELKAEIESKAKETGAKHIMGNGFKVDLIEKKGNVQYKNIPELDGVNLDDYRGKPTSYYMIKEA